MAWHSSQPSRPPLSAALLDREQVRGSGWAHRRSLPSSLHSQSQSLGERSRSAPDYARRGSSSSQVAWSSSFLGMLFGMSDPSTVSQSMSSRRSSLSRSRPLASAALIDREQLDSTQRKMGKRSLSLVSKLDSRQLTDCSNPEPEPAKPRDLMDLNTLEEALPVVRAAVRFRTTLEKNKFDKSDEVEEEVSEVLEMPNKIKPIIRQDHYRKRGRRPHKLY